MYFSNKLISCFEIKSSRTIENDSLEQMGILVLWGMKMVRDIVFQCLGFNKVYRSLATPSGGAATKI